MDRHGDSGIDLHAHTTASDGLLTPAALVRLARARGVSVLAITDHDTAAGVRALDVAGADGVEVIPGIELSAAVGRSDLHLLGYFIDPEHPALLAYEERRRALRTERLQAMVAQLGEAGIGITMDDVRGQVGGDGAPGRPHLARALVAKGFAASSRDCFDRLLLPGGPGYVACEKPGPREAVALIERIGGVAVVAHPALDGVAAHLDELVAAGARGVEVWHSSHGPDDVARLEAYARERGLLMTGGSDFHGEGQREGGGLGSVGCPRACFAALRDASEAAGMRGEMTEPTLEDGA